MPHTCRLAVSTAAFALANPSPKEWFLESKALLGTGLWSVEPPTGVTFRVLCKHNGARARMVPKCVHARGHESSENYINQFWSVKHLLSTYCVLGMYSIGIDAGY